MIGFFLGGMAHLLMAVALNTLIQGTVPDRVRGRAVSFYLLGVLAGIPVGSFALGALGDLVSLRVGLIAYAVVFVAVHTVLHTKNLFPLFDVEKLDD
jgi:MFS family permease